MYVRDVDFAIPRQAWCAWKNDGEDRKLRRALTAQERGMLEARAAQIEPVLAPYRPEETDDVALALSDMLGGMKGERQSAADVVAKIDSLRRLLQPFPAWAIAATCRRIRTEGYDVRDRDGTRREKHWSPADGELVDEVKKTVRMYAEALASARALLDAEVDA